MVVKKREEIRAAHHYLRDFARENRKERTVPEHLLWRCLRNRQLGGYKFRREYVIGDFIADFACLEARLVVELDGGIHAEQQEYDAMRDRFLVAQGFRVLRFENADLTSNLKEALDLIMRTLRETSPLIPSPPLGGEGSGVRGPRES
jgi:5-methyltetrahydrofolate--homocysteine methyltransferase